MTIIDTHALVWMFEADPTLGNKARALIDAEAENGEAMFAPISVWEMAMMVNKNRLVIGKVLAPWIDFVLSTPGYTLSPMTPAMAIDAGTLPGNIHGDPADRLIIATARALGCPIVTADDRIIGYAKAGHVSVIAAHR